MFSLYEGTEYIISIISNTCFTVYVSGWNNVNIQNTEYSEAQSAKIGCEQIRRCSVDGHQLLILGGIQRSD